jgi:hypothetical protein
MEVHNNMAELPPKLKADISILYALAMDGDPATKVNRTADYITLLKNAMRLVEEHKYDKILDENLNRSNIAIKYWYEGGNENQGHAVIICKGIMNDLAFLAYDLRFSDPKSTTFQRTEIKGVI